MHAVLGEPLGVCPLPEHAPFSPDRLAHLVTPSPARDGLFGLTVAGTAPVSLSLEALVEGTIVSPGTG